VVEAFGFHLSRASGSHHIFTHPDIRELVNLQEVHGQVKPYQIRQFVKLVEQYDLKLEGKEWRTITSIFSTAKKTAAYIADIPDLQACSAFGETPDEALRQVELAKSAWLESARKEGKPIPPPKYRPAIYQAAS
jgi:predicted RNase H-like HicB family nuclease/predicted RNA binding protein YcfA (HicA-like mRNA interferase family)